MWPALEVGGGPRRDDAVRPARLRRVHAEGAEVVAERAGPGAGGLGRGRRRVVPARPGERQRVGLAGRRGPGPARPLGHGGRQLGAGGSHATRRETAAPAAVCSDATLFSFFRGLFSMRALGFAE